MHAGKSIDEHGLHFLSQQIIENLLQFVEFDGVGSVGITSMELLHGRIDLRWGQPKAVTQCVIHGGIASVLLFGGTAVWFVLVVGLDWILLRAGGIPLSLGMTAHRGLSRLGKASLRVAVLRRSLLGITALRMSLRRKATLRRSLLILALRRELPLGSTLWVALWVALLRVTLLRIATLLGREASLGWPC